MTVNARYFVTFLELKSQDLNTAERVSPNRFSYRGVHKIYNLESYTSASLFFSRFVFHISKLLVQFTRREADVISEVWLHCDDRRSP